MHDVASIPFNTNLLDNLSNVPSRASWNVGHNISHKKGAPQGAFQLLSLWLCRLGDRDGLARVPYLEARKPAHRDILAELADL